MCADSDVFNFSFALSGIIEIAGLGVTDFARFGFFRHSISRFVEGFAIGIFGEGLGGDSKRVGLRTILELSG